MSTYSIQVSGPQSELWTDLPATEVQPQYDAVIENPKYQGCGVSLNVHDGFFSMTLIATQL